MAIKKQLLAILITLGSVLSVYASGLPTPAGNPHVIRLGNRIIVKPQVFHGVLVNPGIGFTTFQRFNGYPLNKGMGWTEGFPIKYKKITSLINHRYPQTTIAYFRIYWRFIEPHKDVYDWHMIDKALHTAYTHHQQLMLRIAPYGTQANTDAPVWYQKLTHEPFSKQRGEAAGKNTKRRATPRQVEDEWLVNPENPDYVKYFGGMIRALGKRYDGDPNLYLVDVSIVGPWGEGAGSDFLTTKAHRALMNAYLDSFHKTPLVVQLGDRIGARYAMRHSREARAYSHWRLERDRALGEERPRVGWRADCLGDMGGFSKKHNLMTDFYPEAIIEDHLQNAWKTAPIAMEACWVMRKWKQNGWNIPYIMQQAIKWHVSSFNNKSSPVPRSLRPEVDHWLKRMGYRLVLRRFSYPATIGPSGGLRFTSWWVNRGDAPVYGRYVFAIRLSNGHNVAVLPTRADVRSWLPGDNLYNNRVFVPESLPNGEYTLSVGLVDPSDYRPAVKLAIKGKAPDGWYPLGKIVVDDQP